MRGWRSAGIISLETNGLERHWMADLAQRSAAQPAKEQRR